MNKLIQAILDFFKRLFSADQTNTKTKPQMDETKPTQKKLYALLVAIDKYRRPVPALRGCVNDRNALKAYLERQPGRYSTEHQNPDRRRSHQAGYY